MDIKTKTILDKKRLNAFYDYALGSRKLFWIALGAINAGVLFDLLISIGAPELLGEALGLLPAVLIVDALYALFFLIARLEASRSRSLNSTVNYTFAPEGFSEETVNDNYKESSEVKYSALVKVVKNKNDLYLFIARNMAHIVDLSELSEDEVLALKAFVTADLPQGKIKWK